MSDYKKEGESLGAGCYRVGAELHIDAVEVCLAMGVPPTPANQEIAAKAARQLAADENIPEVREVEEPSE